MEAHTVVLRANTNLDSRYPTITSPDSAQSKLEDYIYNTWDWSIHSALYCVPFNTEGRKSKLYYFIVIKSDHSAEQDLPFKLIYIYLNVLQS